MSQNATHIPVPPGFVANGCSCPASHFSVSVTPAAGGGICDDQYVLR
jgi:hypothetical protein